jgi:hypothetical protein
MTISNELFDINHPAGVLTTMHDGPWQQFRQDFPSSLQATMPYDPYSNVALPERFNLGAGTFPLSFAKSYNTSVLGESQFGQTEHTNLAGYIVNTQTGWSI